MKVDRQTSVDQIILLSLYMQFSAEHRGRSGANTERIWSGIIYVTHLCKVFFDV